MRVIAKFLLVASLTVLALGASAPAGADEPAPAPAPQEEPLPTTVIDLVLGPGHCC